MNLWVIFITGLTVGGLTCLAVQGGLLASVIAAKQEDEAEKGQHTHDVIFPTVAFLIAKLFAHTVLGFILGAFGGAIGINQTTQIIMQFMAGAYMIAVALNLLNIHPIFRYVVIQPPKFLTRKVRNVSKRKGLFAPALLGTMSIFIPCGTTLAMEALAISSGNAFLGAAIMAAFVLGTTPLFLGVGWITSILGENYRTRFLKVAAVGVMYLGITSVNGALVASGSPITFQSISEIFQTGILQHKPEKLYSEAPPSQTIQIDVTARGYSPNYIRVKKDSTVSLNLVGKDAYSCASAFRIPSLGISKNLQPNETYKISFTPKKAGKIVFTCSMGMYSGVIEVI